MTGVLSPGEAYRLWAPTYAPETAISALERRGVTAYGPGVAGRDLLDVGCGTGRRFRDAAGGGLRVGVDLVPAMLRAGGPSARAAFRPAVGDVRTLPFRDRAFGVVWCRLVVGHVADLAAAYRELSRVARPHDAHLVVSDFHPAAAAAGHTRTFRDGRGDVHAVVHHRHAVEDHHRAAEDGGWRVTGVHDLTPGEAERPFWTAAGRGQSFDAQRDLPLVLLLRLGR